MNDPSVNIAVGSKIMKDLIVRYKGDVRAALQAYHDGIGNYESGKMGPEGKAYIGKIEKMYKAYTGRNLDDDYKRTGSGVEGLPPLLKKMDALISALNQNQSKLPVRKK